MWKDGFCNFKNELNISYKYGVLNPIFLPKCPKFTKEGGGPNADQKVLIFLSQIGGEGRGSITFGQSPKIYTFFILKTNVDFFSYDGAPQP